MKKLASHETTTPFGSQDDFLIITNPNDETLVLQNEFSNTAEQEEEKANEENQSAHDTETLTSDIHALAVKVAELAGAAATMAIESEVAHTVKQNAWSASAFTAEKLAEGAEAAGKTTMTVLYGMWSAISENKAEEEVEMQRRAAEKLTISEIIKTEAKVIAKITDETAQENNPEPKQQQKPKADTPWYSPW